MAKSSSPQQPGAPEGASGYNFHGFLLSYTDLCIGSPFLGGLYRFSIAFSLLLDIGIVFTRSDVICCRIIALGTSTKLAWNVIPKPCTNRERTFRQEVERQVMKMLIGSLGRMVLSECFGVGWCPRVFVP